jgi:predicted transcriptional regulator
MSTTTIRLPDDLKARVVAAAERAGTSAHGFILEAIAEKAAAAELRADFAALADERHAAHPGFGPGHSLAGNAPLS